LKTLNFNHFNIKVICIEILTITKKIKKRRNEIVKFLKKNYTLKFKSARYATNYIFIKK